MVSNIVSLNKISKAFLAAFLNPILKNLYETAITSNFQYLHPT